MYWCLKLPKANSEAILFGIEPTAYPCTFNLISMLFVYFVQVKMVGHTASIMAHAGNTFALVMELIFSIFVILWFLLLFFSFFCFCFCFLFRMAARQILLCCSPVLNYNILAQIIYKNIVESLWLWLVY